MRGRLPRVTTFVENHYQYGVYEKESTNAQEITLPKYKLEQIADLENICEVALNKLGKTLVMGDEFCSN